MIFPGNLAFVRREEKFTQSLIDISQEEKQYA